MKLCFSFLLILISIVLQAQDWNLVDLKHFYGAGDQQLAGLAAGSNGESFALISWEDRLRYESQINLSSPNIQVKDNYALIKIDREGQILWYRHIYSPNRIDFRDMIYSDSTGLIVLFNQVGMGHYEYGHGTAARFAGNGDFTVVNYDDQGDVVWHNRFDAKIQGNYHLQDGHLALSDSGFFVALTHEDNFDADVKSSAISLTGDGGGINASLIEYDFQLNYRRHYSWTSADEVMVKEMVYNGQDQLLLAFYLKGSMDAAPRNGDSLVFYSPATGWGGAYIYTNYLIAYESDSFSVDWHQRLHSTNYMSVNEVVYDPLKDWWWFSANYSRDFETFDSPKLSRTGLSWSYPDAIYLAYDSNGQRSFTGELTSLGSNTEKASQFIPSPQGYLVLGVVDQDTDLDFRVNHNLTNSRNKSGLVISHYDTNLSREWAYLRMEHPSHQTFQSTQSAVRLGKENFLFGLSSGPYSSQDLNFGPKLDSASRINAVAGKDAFLAQWRTCEDLDTNLIYQNGIFYAADTTADHYEWVSCLDDSVVAAGPDPFYQPPYRTWLYLRFSKDQCQFRTACVVANDVGLAEIGDLLNIYPNPASGEFRVDWQGGEALDLVLYNSRGESVQELSIQSGSQRFEVAHPAGLYILKAVGKSDFNFKLILR